MKIEYFEDTDTIYIDIKDSTSVESKEVSIVLDFDSNNDLTGIEIDNAKQIAPFSDVEFKNLAEFLNYNRYVQKTVRDRGANFTRKTSFPKTDKNSSPTKDKPTFSIHKHEHKFTNAG